MQIRRCTISYQGLFDNTTFNLSEKINIIYGKNGSGKSFLARALVDSIWKTTENESILSGSSWENLFVDLMISLSSVDHFKMTCNRSSKPQLSYIDNDSTITLNREPGNPGETSDGTAHKKLKLLHSFFNQINRQTYLQSSFMPSPADLENDQKLDYHSTKNVILNDQSNFYSLFINLSGKGPAESHHNRLLSEILKHEGKVKELTKNIRIIDIQSSRNDKLISEKKKITREIDSMRKTLSSTEAQKAIYLDIKENLLDTDRLHKKLNAIKEEVETEQQKTDLIETMKDEISKEYPEFKGLDIDNTENLNRLQNIFNEARNINERIDSFYSQKAGFKKRIKKLVLTIIIAYITINALLFYTGVTITNDNIKLFGSGLGITAAVTGMLLALPSLLKGTKKLESLKKRKKEVTEEMQELAAKTNINKDSFNISELYEFLLQYFENYIEYSEKTREMVDIQRSLKDKDHLKKIEKDLELLKAEEELIQKIINENLASLNLPGNKKISPDEIDDIIEDMDNRIGSLHREIESKDKIVSQIEIEIRQGGSNDSDELDGMLSEKKETEKILKGLYNKNNTLQYVTDVLSSAVNKSEERQLDRLVNMTLDTFNFMTGSQYVSRVDHPIIKKFISEQTIPDELNPTTIHYLILSIKIALSDFLAVSGISAPLIIDDPFIFMDDEKIDHLKELVLDISRKRQVIIFTHKIISHDWGNLITL